LDKHRNTIFSVMGALCLGAGSFGFMNMPENTQPLPEPTQQVAFTGTINRLELKDLSVITNHRMYNWKDVTCLARNIYFEARNESVLGQHMVAWTTMNRVKHKKFPKTVCKVVYQKGWVSKHQRYYGQFSWTNKMKDKKAYNRKAFLRATLVAKDTLHEFYSGGEDLSKGALFYHADYVSPKWDFKKLTMLTQVDTHIFYKHK